MSDSNHNDNNPLFVKQREKAGSQTFDKYDYQYHWALYKVITEFNNSDSNEYAVFIELHEDVVFANHLDVNKVKFDFYQVKNISTGAFNITKLIKRKKNKKSILGKLCESTQNKVYSDKILTINLVATCGFNFQELDKQLEQITIGDLSDNTIGELKKALTGELNIDDVPANLYFVVPEMPTKGYKEYLIGKISEIVKSLYPECYYQSDNIYRVLIDEFYRKGKNTFDYSKWTDSVKNKAVSSLDVNNVINVYTDTGKKDLDFNFSEICNELDFSYLKRKHIKKFFDKYAINRSSNPSLILMKQKKSIVNGIKSNTSVDLLTELIKCIIESIPQNIKDTICSENELLAMIIYEIIQSEDL